MKGFTLIEILIVLVIMGIMATIASISIMGAGRTGNLQNAANNFSQAVTLASQYAITQPAEIGMTIDSTGYRFYQFTLQDGDNHVQNGSWEPVTGVTALAPQKFPSNTSVDFQYNVKRDLPFDVSGSPVQPKILITSNSNMTPFILKLGYKGGIPLFEVTADSAGNMTFERLGTLPNTAGPGAKNAGT